MEGRGLLEGRRKLQLLNILSQAIKMARRRDAEALRKPAICQVKRILMAFHRAIMSLFPFTGPIIRYYSQFYFGQVMASQRKTEFLGGTASARLHSGLYAKVFPVSWLVKNLRNLVTDIFQCKMVNFIYIFLINYGKAL